MNLKLLEKLVRLANNNPNEHEANLAARRACRLIAEGNFNFTEAEVKTTQSRPITYNDITRSDEPMWRSKPQQSASDAYWEMIDNMRKQREKEFKERFDRKSDFDPFRDPREPQRGYYNKNDEKYYNRKAARGYDINNNKRNLMCKTCKQAKDTIFMGLESVFECNECTWNAFTKGK